MPRQPSPAMEAARSKSATPRPSIAVDPRGNFEGAVTPPNNGDVKSEATTLTPGLERLYLKMEAVNHKLGNDPLRPEELASLEMPAPPLAEEVKPTPKGPQLIGHLPRAEAEALQAFAQIFDNHYQYGTLGRSREALESMTCDCQYEHGVDDSTHACGHGSDCINRLTQVECMPDDCRCRSYCQNQRFQRKDYAELEIVQTEKKGFGLRAATDLRKDTFIYEYVGEVVSLISFKKRMRDYAAEGIRHFYFMMLQKDEFIDATKRGGIGRFANHSCNPNCYVARWTVGQYVRMGIFSNRNIRKDEELTFNYNVDRYGHDAQPCYCGEAQCSGFIGGKTQTDIGAMDDLYLDALGITEDVERLGLKGSKKKRAKKLDEDWVPTLRPMLEKDVPKVVQAMRQTQSRKVLLKLLTRIKITEDQAALRQLMRLRGFSLMTNVLEDFAQDIEVTALTLECVSTWPLLQRNKVDDSKIIVPVTICASSEHEAIKSVAQKLLDHWDTLESGYRIPKRLKQDGDEEEDMPSLKIVQENESAEPKPPKRSRYEELFFEATVDLKPLAPIVRPNPQALSVASAPSNHRAQRRPTREDIAQIIAAASAAAAAAKQAPPANGSGDAGNTSKKSHSSKSGKAQVTEDKEANKEKRLLKLVGAVVVKCMSKHQKQMDHDVFKKHAKELTRIIAEKEKKSSSYKEGRLDSLSDEKVAKIKKFAKEYIVKILRKLDKSKHRSPHLPSASSATAASSLEDTPNSHEDIQMTSVAMDEPMDLDDDVNHASDREDVELSGGEEPESNQPESLPPDNRSPSTGDRMYPHPSPPANTHSSDPRSRPPDNRELLGSAFEEVETIAFI